MRQRNCQGLDLRILWETSGLRSVCVCACKRIGNDTIDTPGADQVMLTHTTCSRACALSSKRDVLIRTNPDPTKVKDNQIGQPEEG